MEDCTAFMETEEGEPPGELADYVGIISARENSAYTLELTPGEYVATCFMPDHFGEAAGFAEAVA